uniref:Polymerase/histidinol phosphatase N-terminal domain-containing protein n=1 Tax=Uncultured bacterium HF130_AEPn_1 TaxID=663362 RepID=D0E8J4_UNCHF|nr:hypothetical protein ALOHA_HF130_AEPn_1_15c [uncultured bacterium HF130_AEPn_1]
MYSKTIICFLAAFSLVFSACQKDQTSYSKVKKIEDLSEAIGGDGAVAKVGDYILENDKIRLVVSGHQRGQSYGPGIFAGSIIDADLQRKDGMHRSGHGSDSISEFFPTVALGIANPDLDGGMDIWSSGGSKKTSILVSYGKMENYLELLDVLKDLINVEKWTKGFSRPEYIINLYILDPGTNTLKLTTLVHNTIDKSNPKLSGEITLKEYLDGFNGDLDSLLAEYPELGTLDAKMEVGQERDSEGNPKQLGAFDLVFEGGSGGDFVFFGRKIDVFSPGYGFGYARGIQDLFFKDKSSNSISNPLPYSALVGLGDDVSLALYTVSADKSPSYLYVPLFESSISLYLSHGDSYLKPGVDEKFKLRKKFKRFRFTRYLSLGDGDPASALKTVYERKGIPTGGLSGRLYERASGKVVHHGEIMVICDPGGKDYTDVEDLLDANRKRGLLFGLTCDETIKKEIKTSKDTIKLDSDGVITMLKVNSGYKAVPDDKFEGVVPAGSYYLSAVSKGYAPGPPQKVKIEAGKEKKVSLVLGQNGEVEVKVSDEKGEFIPFKLSVGHCFPECNTSNDCSGEEICKIVHGRGQCQAATCSSDNDCDRDEVCNKAAKGGARCECAVDNAKRLPGLYHESLNGPNQAFGVVKRKYFYTSPASMSLPEGEYDLLISRGTEYEIVRDRISIKAGQTDPKRYVLPRVVDTEGWISADFHVHGIHSFDGNVGHANRVLSAMGENLEIISTSDHDAITDIAPFVREANAQRYVAAQTGTEITSLEFGHFLSYPLTKDWNQSQGAPLDWRGKTPGKIFDEIRSYKSPAKPMITVAHPRDGLFGYFDQFSLEPMTLKIDDSSLLDVVIEMFAKQPCGDQECSGKILNFCPDFDGMELFNGIHLEVLRWGSIKELRDNELKVNSLYPNKSYFDNYDENMESLKKLIVRTRSEEYMMPYLRDGVPKTCKSNADCKGPFKGTKYVCEKDVCVINAKDEVSGGDVAALSCTSTKDCPGGLACTGAQGKKVCKVVSCDKGLLGKDDDALCIGSNGTKGVIDDWFYMLNHGIFKVGFGNSDTHTLKAEIGLPRNYVKVTNDYTDAYDEQEFHGNVAKGKLFTSYGPIINAEISGKTMGETLDISGSSGSKLKLNVRVQSPLWFDVDRVEIYENGKLIRIACDKKKYDDGEDCEDLIDSPNLTVENYSNSIDISPDKDSWYVVIAMGLHGKSLSPVFNEEKLASYQVSEILNRGIGGIQNGALSGLIQSQASSLLESVAKYPRVFPVMPYAVSNPIFVKVSSGKEFESLLGKAPFVRQLEEEFKKGGVQGVCNSKFFSNASQPFLLKLNNSYRHGDK